MTNLNGPMVERLRACAADTSPNWDGRITIYPPEARQLVALIDSRTVDITPAVIRAYIDAPDEPDGDILGPLRAAFRAAGLTVGGGESRD